LIYTETDNVLSPSTGGGFSFTNYMKDAVSVVKQYDYSELREIQLPAVGNSRWFWRKEKDKTLYYSLLITQRQEQSILFDPNVPGVTV
jgi:prolyl oligopeptidase